MTVLFRPARRDLATIGLLLGRVLLGVGAAMLLVAAAGLALGEVDAAAGLAIGACTALLPGLVAERALRPAAASDVTWAHGMVTAALAWLVAPVAGAVPLFLSGHHARFLDAWFDAVSGFTATGLTTVQDLDHLPDALVLWRATMQLLGAQAFVVAALSLFPGRRGGIAGVYAGEARAVGIVPNVRRTARALVPVVGTFLVVGAALLWAALVRAGLPPGRAALHALVLALTAVDTGGFAPLSSSLAAYRSALVEAIVAGLALAGATSLLVHLRVRAARGLGALRDLEVRVLAGSLVVLFGLVAVGLIRDGVAASPGTLLRLGGPQLVAAHTGTALTTVPGGVVGTGWGVVAPGALVLAMAIGGMAGSTTGGMKAVRLGLVGRILGATTRRTLLPPDVEVLQTYRHGHQQVLRTPVARAATLVLILLLALALAGTIVGLFYGIPLEQALFESTSAATNAGLSTGVTGPGMPTGLEVTYAVQMWLGRVELLAGFALLGFGWSMLRSPR